MTINEHIDEIERLICRHEITKEQVFTKMKYFIQHLYQPIRKAYIEGYSMGHHHTVESCYCPEEAADDWLSEQHQ